MKGHDRFWLGLILLVYVLLVGRVMATRHYWPRYDSGLFISEALSIHQGLGLRDITGPVSLPEHSWVRTPSWSDFEDGQAKKPWWPFFLIYPPGLPLLLVPFLKLGKGSFLLLRLPGLLAGLLTLLFLYRWRRDFFGEAWVAVLLVQVFSIATLYALRVQSEIFLLPLGLVFLRFLSKSVRTPGVCLRCVAVAAGTLAFATFIHMKLLFLGVGAALFLLLERSLDWSRRWRAAASLMLAILPIALWLTNVTFSADAGPGRSWSFLFSKHPERLEEAAGDLLEVAHLLGGRLAKTLACLAESLFIIPVKDESWTTVVQVLCFLILVRGFRSWYRQSGKAVAWPVLAELAGCYLLTPWAEARFTVLVQPFFVHWFLCGLPGNPGDGRDSRVSGTDPAALTIFSKLTRAPLVLGLVLGIQGLCWAGFDPERDTYAQESHSERVPLLWFAERTPADHLLLWFGDNAAVALLSGRAVVSLTSVEWKNSHPGFILDQGKNWTAILFFPPWRPKPVPFSLPSFFQHRMAEIERGAWFCHPYDLETVTLGPRSWPASGTIAPDDPAARYRSGIHPRWLTISPADAASLARAIFP